MVVNLLSNLGRKEAESALLPEHLAPDDLVPERIFPDFLCKENCIFNKKSENFFYLYFISFYV